MDFSEHVVISTAGSAAILAGGGGWESAAAFSAVGIFMDLDHFLDYWRETGLNLDIPRFMNYFSTRQPKRMILLLHGWEQPSLVLAALLLKGGAPEWCFWGIAAWFTHLTLDQRYNKLHKLAYFSIFRIKHRFNSDVFNLD